MKTRLRPGTRRGLTTIEVPLSTFLVILALNSASQFEARLDADAAAARARAVRLVTAVPPPPAVPVAPAMTEPAEIAPAPRSLVSRSVGALAPVYVWGVEPPVARSRASRAGSSEGGGAGAPLPMQRGYDLPRQRIPVEFLTPGIFTPIAIPVAEPE